MFILFLTQQTYMEKLANIAENHKEDIRIKIENKQIEPGMFDAVQRDLFGILRIQFFRDYAKTPEYPFILF
jgi:hypothetical protein